MSIARWLSVCLTSILLGGATAAFGQAPSDRPTPFVPKPPARAALAGNHPVDFGQIERLETELAALRRRLERQEALTRVTSAVPRSSRQSVSRRRWYTGFEFTLLKPRMEDGAEEDLNGDMLDYQMRLGPRVWVGYVDPQQAGIRARYWQYDQASKSADVAHVPIVPGPKRMSVEAHTVDLEVTQAMAFCHWDFTFAAGMRYALFEQRVDSLAGSDFVMKRFHGIGPTCSLENRLPLFGSQLSLVFSSRGSVLVGESRWAHPPASNDTDDIASIVDVQLGLEWLRKFDRGRSVYFRFAWEQQHWFGAGTFFDGEPTTPHGILAITPSDHDVAFMGPAMALGAMW